MPWSDENEVDGEFIWWIESEEGGDEDAEGDNWDFDEDEHDEFESFEIDNDAVSLFFFWNKNNQNKFIISLKKYKSSL